jgi:aryl-alcohol dehydrogenase-like predicted oxidoreductase
VATKVRIMPDQVHAIAATARNSVLASLRRLRLERVRLLQVHNSITAVAGAEPTSLTPAHVLAPGGLLDAMKKLQRDGLVEHLGLTGLGEPAALREVIDSGHFASVQIPYNLLNDSAGRDVPANLGADEANYGNVICHCARQGMGVFAIRVLAGGALADRPPSPHTFKTPFFPLALYERDRRRAEDLARCLPPGVTLPEAAVRFALSHPQITSAIIGLATPAEVTAATTYAATDPLHQVVGPIKWG